VAPNPLDVQMYSILLDCYLNPVKNFLFYFVYKFNVVCDTKEDGIEYL